jgi:hypothetical protein
MIYFGSSNHKIKINWSKKKKQIGGQNQDGRQALTIHSSVNSYANRLKLGICEERSMKKIL